MKDYFEYNTLLTREKFKQLGFLRTKGMCCIPGCREHADDAHHIMDRKLWSDSGYYLSNCAPVCYQHHMDCEKMKWTPYQVMKFADIDIKYLQKPDKLDWLSFDEYKELFINGEINKWGK